MPQLPPLSQTPHVYFSAANVDLRTESLLEPCIYYTGNRKEGIDHVGADFVLRDTAHRYTPATALDAAFFKAVGLDAQRQADISQARSDHLNAISDMLTYVQDTLSPEDISLWADVETVVNTVYCAYATANYLEIPSPYRQFYSFLAGMRPVLYRRKLSAGLKGHSPRGLIRALWDYCEAQRQKLRQSIIDKTANVDRGITDVGVLALRRTKTIRQAAHATTTTCDDDAVLYIEAGETSEERLRRATCIFTERSTTFPQAFDVTPQAVPLIYKLITLMDRAHRATLRDQADGDGSATCTTATEAEISTTANDTTSARETEAVPATQAAGKISTVGIYDQQKRSYTISKETLARAIYPEFDTYAARRQRQLIGDLSLLCEVAAKTSCTIYTGNRSQGYQRHTVTMFNVTNDFKIDTLTFTDICDLMRTVFLTGGQCDGRGYITIDMRPYDSLSATTADYRKELRDQAIRLLNHLLALVSDHIGKTDYSNRIQQAKAASAGLPRPPIIQPAPLILRNSDLYTWQQDGKHRLRVPILQGSAKRPENRELIWQAVITAMAKGGYIITRSGSDKSDTITILINPDLYDLRQSRTGLFKASKEPATKDTKTS